MLHRGLPARGHGVAPRQVRPREPSADGDGLTTQHRRRPERPARIRVAVVPWDDGEAADLRARQEAELAARYLENGEPGAPPSAADMAVFVLARDADGAAIACGGLRPLDLGPLEPAGAELKRMYVVPESRGLGVADVVLHALEGHAAERGWRTLRLATGDRQPDAIRFYARAGYAEIEPFGPYVGAPLVRCFERRLR